MCEISLHDGIYDEPNYFRHAPRPHGKRFVSNANVTF